jgi:hypothetical protein
MKRIRSKGSKRRKKIAELQRDIRESASKYPERQALRERDRCLELRRHAKSLRDLEAREHKAEALLWRLVTRGAS